MPVRSSLCTYSPAAAASGRSSVLGGGVGSSSSSSKYSSMLTSPSCYGHYKPLTSSTRSYASPTPSSGSSECGRYSHLSGYSSTSSSAASTTGSSSTTPSASYSVGLYKPLSSMRRYPSSGGQSTRPFSSISSPSTSSLTSTSSSLSSASSSGGADHLGANSGAGGYQPYKSSGSLSTSAYSSGSSLSSSPSSTSSSSSTGSATNYSSPYSSLRQSRFLSSSSSRAPATASVGRSESLPREAPSGLVNLGNTCYMNASLQALYSLDSFRELIKRNGGGGGGGASERPLTSELAELFKQMKESAETGQPLSPANFKFAFARHQSKFSGFGQQDAQEFLRYLIDGVHEESNSARRRKRHRHPGGSAAPRTAHEAWAQYRDIVDDSPLVDLLVGQLCSTITCSECHNKSHCWDPFWDLSLPLSSRSASARGGGLSHPSGGSTSSAGSLGSWRSIGSSSSCGGGGGGGGGRSSRLSGIIDEFTSKETLDSEDRPHCSHCKRPTRSTKQISLARLPQVLILHLKKFTNDGYKLTNPELQIDKHLTFDGRHHYQLRACISHHGHSSSSGHYTSHCDYSSRWLHFDDNRVRDVTQTFDCNKLDDAYVLFYTQQQQLSSSSASSTGSSRRPSRSSTPPSDTATSQSKL